MNALRALGLFALLSGACAVPQQPAEPKPKVDGATRTLFLNEPFALSGASCKVSAAKSALVESDTLPYPEARVRPDVRALEMTLHCQDARGIELEGHKVLPPDSVVLLRLSGEKTLAPRPGDPAHSALIFDLPDDVDPELPSARRFDTGTGKSVVPREQAVAKLALRTGTLALEVQLRQRYQDAALDALVDQLALALASGSGLSALAADTDAERALAQLAAIYEDVRRRFQPARLELTALSAEATTPRTITLSLTRPRNHESAFEVARFQLTLAQAETRAGADPRTATDGALRVQSFDNREAARNALACDALKDAFQRELALLPSAPAHKKPETCNALGLLLPAPCNELAPSLLTRAIELGARCGEPFQTRVEARGSAREQDEARGSAREQDEARGSAREQNRAKKSALPGDFQITLRRGRPESGLDRSPRYVVALFHGGQVVFHGKHWVESQERSDGRTDLGLLGGLYQHIRTLDFFARRGGEYTPERCNPSDDQGDVVTVVAGDKQRMVLNRAGCRGPFSEGELTELRRQVERIAGLSAWTQRAATVGDRDAEQWAIAE
jgi:hypothetical protein